MKLNPVRKRKISLKQIVRKSKCWLLSLIGISASVITLVGCGRVRRMGVMPEPELERVPSESHSIEYNKSRKVDEKNNSSQNRGKKCTTSSQNHSIDTTDEQLYFNGLPGDIAPLE